MKFVSWTDPKSEECEYLAEIKAQKIETVGGVRIYECPLTFIEPETWDLIDVCFLISDTHNLWFDGNWSSQPAWLYEAYLIYKNYG